MHINDLLSAAIAEIDLHGYGYITDLYLKVGEPPYFYKMKETVAPSSDFLPQFVGQKLDSTSVKAICDYCWDKNLEKNKSANIEDPQLSFAFEYNDKWRIRAHISRVYPQKRALCFRLIPSVIPDLDELDLPETLKHIAIENNRGLIIISGPTGSGKTTTIASIMKGYAEVNKGHIATLEDPVEYIYNFENRLVTQQSVGPGQHVANFKEGIFGLLRDKADVIMVGELRDTESIQAAIQAAGSHLVLTTTHHTQALRVLEYLVNKFPESERKAVKTELMDALLAVSCQNILPGRDSSGDLKMVTAYEILLNNAGFKKALAEDKAMNMSILAPLIEKANGCVMWQDRLDQLLQRRMIDYEVYRRHASKDIEDIQGHMKKIG